MHFRNKLTLLSFRLSPLSRLFKFENGQFWKSKANTIRTVEVILSGETSFVVRKNPLLTEGLKEGNKLPPRHSRITQLYDHHPAFPPPQLRK